MNTLTNSKPERYLNVCFQIHQPRRLTPHGFFDRSSVDAPLGDDSDRTIVRKVARNCYQPVNLMLLKLIHKYPKLRITFSISAVALEQLEEYCPAVIESFRMLASTDSVEFVAEPYNHSLCSVMDPQELIHQVSKHTEVMERLLGVKPTVFRNTEFIYPDQLASVNNQLGFKGIYVDDIESTLYKRPLRSDFKLFVRNEIAIRFLNKTGQVYPLTAQKYISWLGQHKPSKNNQINVEMDYETFGEHQKDETVTLHFLEDFLSTVACSKTTHMINPTEMIQRRSSDKSIFVSDHISQNDRERVCPGWLGNDIHCDSRRDFQTSDHLYYMSTKTGEDGNVLPKFSPLLYEASMN